MKRELTINDFRMLSGYYCMIENENTLPFVCKILGINGLSVIIKNSDNDIAIWHDLSVIRPLVRSIYEMTDNEALDVASLSLAYKLENNPTVHRYECHSVPCIAVINGKRKSIDNYDQLSRIKTKDWIEIDSGFSVRCIHNTLCNMPEVIQYLTEKHFDILGLLSIKTDKFNVVGICKKSYEINFGTLNF